MSVKFIIYNNSMFNSPIEIDLSEITPEDQYLLVLPLTYQVPRNKNEIIIAQANGYKLYHIAEIN